MKLNEIIREKRKLQGITQEKLAMSLGVSTSAVNKWENGNSYPDITLLPKLANLLNTDINNLFSFNVNLTDEEIGEFLNSLVEIMEKSGFETVFSVATEKMEQYPNCHILAYNTALFLEGFMFLNDIKEEVYKIRIYEIYEKLSKVENSDISDLAKERIVLKYIFDDEFEKAVSLIDTIKERQTVDKEFLQSKIYTKKGEFKESGKILEKKFINYSTKIYNVLFELLDISVKMQDEKMSFEIAKIMENTAYNYKFKPFFKVSPYLHIYSLKKDGVNLINTLENFYNELKHSDFATDYRTFFIDGKENTDMKKIDELFIKKLKESEELEFIKDNSDYKKILQKMEAVFAEKVV